MRTFLGRGAVLLAIALGVSCSPLPLAPTRQAAETLPFVRDFESGGLSGLYTETARTGSPSVVPGQGYLGSSGLVVEVDPADLVNNGNRAEVALYNLSPYGETLFYGWRFFIPASDPDGFQWQILAQWYQLPDFPKGETFDFFYAHPPVHLVYVPGFLEIKTTVGGERTLGRTAISKGVWHSVVFEIRFRTDERGFVQTWVDGAPVTASNGTDFRTYGATLHNRAGTYLKLGLYRGYVNQTQASSANTVVLDNLAVGRTYAEVMP